MTPRPKLSPTDQIALCIGFFTRIRVHLPEVIPDDALARAAWAFPVAGAVIGLMSACVMMLALKCGVGANAAGIIGLAASMLLTGALHEDGLADTADGFGGGRDKPAKLAIMRDSRIGSYGVLALVVSVALRVDCLARIAGHGDGAVWAALVAAHATARASLPMMMASLPLARPNGAAAAAGRSGVPDAVGAALLAAIVLLSLYGPGNGCLAALLAIAAVYGMARLASRQVGGYTGDVLGALEQVVEVLVLLVAAHQ